jgi:phosphocarrier protein
VSHVEQVCQIQNKLGLHLRAAAAFVKVAERFKSDVSLERDGTRANGKSIIALVARRLARNVGEDRRRGPDAEAAVGAPQLVEDRFGEGA